MRPVEPGVTRPSHLPYTQTWGATGKSRRPRVPVRLQPHPRPRPVSDLTPSIAPTLCLALSVHPCVPPCQGRTFTSVAQPSSRRRRTASRAACKNGLFYWAACKNGSTRVPFARAEGGGMTRRHRASPPQYRSTGRGEAGGAGTERQQCPGPCFYTYTVLSHTIQVASTGREGAGPRRVRACARREGRQRGGTRRHGRGTR